MSEDMVINMAKATMMMLICILTIIGNSLVIIVGVKNWQHTSHHMTHLLVFHLAIADLAEASVVEPVEFVEELLGEWILGKSACKFIEYFQATSLTASVFFITFIAIDRYLSVVRPFTGRLKARHGKYIAAFCWIFASVICIPYAIIFAVVPLRPGTNDTGVICEPLGIDNVVDRIYWTVEAYYTFLLPLIVMCFCYTSLVRKVLKMKKVGGPSPSSNSDVENVIHIRSLNTLKKKSLRLALSFVTLFIVCWTPKFVLQCYRLIHGTHYVHRKDPLYEVALFMSLTNEMLNPVLYALIDVYFRQKLLNLCGKRRQSMTTETNTT